MKLLSAERAGDEIASINTKVPKMKNPGHVDDAIKQINRISCKSLLFSVLVDKAFKAGFVIAEVAGDGNCSLWTEMQLNA